MRIAWLVLLITSSVLTPKGRADSLSLNVQKFRLANGLTVLLHEDHLTPAVAIQLGFRAGSRHEPKGRSESAHLVEHLMNGPSLNDKAERAESLRKIGALFINASTFPDYTIYHATVPTHALDAALWIEADRMANLLPAVEQSVLDAQRMSVMNERREKDEDRPYGAAWRLLSRHLYPPAHPYHHIGNDYRDDLKEVKLTDVYAWVNSRHGASNTVLVLAGDVDLETAKLKVEKYFGNIPPGPPPDVQEIVWTPRMNEPKRVLMHDRVTQTRIYAAWNVAPVYTASAINLAIAAKILAGGPGTRLHDRMVVRDRIATSASTSLGVQALSSQFVITLTAAGAPAARVEEVLNEELRRFIESGPSDDELASARARIRLEKAQEVRYLYGKARALSIAELVTGNADSYDADLRHLQTATAQSVAEAAKRWLVTERLTLIFEPYRNSLRTGTGTTPERPVVTASRETRAPVIQRLELANGLTVAMLDRPGSPLTDLTLLLPGGASADPPGKSGVARLALSILSSGDDELLQRLENSGRRLTKSLTADSATLSVTGLSGEIERWLPIFSDILLRREFPDAVLERERARLLSDLHNERRQAFDAALRLVPALLVGEMPFSGTGTEDSIRSITRQDVDQYLRTNLNIRAVTAILIGDLGRTEPAALLERSFRLGPAARPVSPRERIARSMPAGVYLLDRSGVQQTAIFALHLAPPMKAPDDVATELAVDILGGVGGRILRELKTRRGWSYGAGSTISKMRGNRIVFTGGSFQTDKAVDAIQELDRQLRDFVGINPPSAEEVSDAKTRVLRIKPAYIEPIEILSRVIREAVEFDLGDDYVGSSMRQVQHISATDVRRAATAIFGKQPRAWVVVGNAANLESKLMDAGFRDIHVLADESAVLNKLGTPAQSQRMPQ